MTEFEAIQQKYYEYREEAIRHFGGLIPEMEDYVNALEERENLKLRESEELLKKYIRYVFEAEGSDNIRYGKDYGADTEFTEEEWEKLEIFAIEVNGEETWHKKKL